MGLEPEAAAPIGAPWRNGLGEAGQVGEESSAQSISLPISGALSAPSASLCRCCMGWGGRESATAHQVSTAEDNGILLYNGDNDHIAVELYQGHVRVSYDPGSYPSSAIYR